VDELIELVLTLLVQMRDKNTGLAARLASALRQLYGRRSEKISSEQLSLLFATLGDEVPPGFCPTAPGCFLMRERERAAAASTV
jgi:hypothetical protein